MADQQESRYSAEIMPRGPDNWKLNVFLSKVQNRLEETEFVKIKDMLSGTDGFGPTLLLEMKSVTDLFFYLKSTKMISKENIIVLQAIVWHIGKRDLYEEMVTLAGELDMLGETLHIVSPPGQPENGYKFAKFHIRGPKFPVKEQLENLRGRVADWMCVPPQFVTVHGIEPSGSWIITFMVPEICVSVLLGRAKTHGHWFTAMDIDRFEVDGDVITIDVDATILQSQEPDPLEKENQRLREKVEHLEKSKEHLDILSIQQNREKVALEEKYTEIGERMMKACQERESFLFGLFLMAVVYLNLFKKSFVEEGSLGLGLKNGAVAKLESALVAYRRNMKKVKREGYDVELIGDLLESFRCFALKRNLEELRLSQFILAGSNGGKPFTSPTTGMQWSVNITTMTEIEYKPEFLQVLRGIGNCLRKQERYKIMKSSKDAHFTAEEKNLYSKDSDENTCRLLEVVLFKSNQYVFQRSKELWEHPNEIIKDLLEQVNRRDLVKKFDADILKCAVQEREEALKQAPRGSAYQLLVISPVVRLTPRSSCSENVPPQF